MRFSRLKVLVVRLPHFCFHFDGVVYRVFSFASTSVLPAESDRICLANRSMLLFFDALLLTSLVLPFAERHSTRTGVILLCVLV